MGIVPLSFFIACGTGKGEGALGEGTGAKCGEDAVAQVEAEDIVPEVNHRL